MLLWELDSPACSGHKAMAVCIIWHLSPSLGYTCPGGCPPTVLFFLTLGPGTGLGPSRHAVCVIVPVTKGQVAAQCRTCRLEITSAFFRFVVVKNTVRERDLEAVGQNPLNQGGQAGDPSYEASSTQAVCAKQDK